MPEPFEGLWDLGCMFVLGHGLGHWSLSSRGAWAISTSKKPWLYGLLDVSDSVRSLADEKRCSSAAPSPAV